MAEMISDTLNSKAAVYTVDVLFDEAETGRYDEDPVSYCARQVCVEVLPATQSSQRALTSSTEQDSPLPLSRTHDLNKLSRGIWEHRRVWCSPWEDGVNKAFTELRYVVASSTQVSSDVREISV